MVSCKVRGLVVRQRGGRRDLILGKREQGAFRGTGAMQSERDAVTLALEAHRTIELRNGARIRHVEDMDLRIAETGKMKGRTRRGHRAQPVGIRDVEVRIVERDRLHQADVVVAFERGERDGVGPVVQLAGANRKGVGYIGLVAELHLANRGPVERDGYAVTLGISRALQSDLQRDG